VWLDRKNERNKDYRKPSASYAPSRNNPTDAALNSPLHRRHPSEEEHRSEEQAHWKRQIRIEIAALIISSLALAGVVIGYVSLRSQTDAVWETVEAAKASVAQARRQANAAERMAIDAVRPIIWIPKTSLAFPLWYNPSPDGNLAAIFARVEYSNFGSGAALNVRISWCLNIKSIKEIGKTLYCWPSY
jgi:hypothetical protein